MTEKEAKEKWCPKTFSRPEADGDGKCLASDCAVWIWDYCHSATGELPREQWQGHCGLIQR